MKSIKFVVATFAVLVSVSFAIPAAAQNYPVVCAHRDDQLVPELQQIGEAQTVPGDILYEAFRVLTRARRACKEGRMELALALYDSIFTTSLAGRLETPE